MKKTVKYILTTLWVLSSRGYDAYCTNQFTPDLSSEANPLVSILGLSWAPLLIILGLLTLYTVFAYYVSVFQPINLLPEEKGYSFSNFIGYLYLGKKGSWASTLYKLPTDPKRFNQYMGEVLTKCLVFAGAVSTLMWYLINNTQFYKSIHSAFLIYSILIAGSIMIIYFWNRQKYKEYLGGVERNDMLETI